MRLLQGRARLLTVVSLLGAAGGCGWTPRDEFYANRGVVIHSQPGDGSRLAYTPTAHERAVQSLQHPTPVGSALASVPDH
jgi:hypothetical protein